MESLYDYNANIQLMEAKGKQLFGEHFTIPFRDYELITRLLVYVLNDKIRAKELNISLQKGIVVLGPVGCGKTSLMTLLRCFLPKSNRFVIKTCREVSFEFIQEGYQTILKYSRNSFKNEMPVTYCFDDLGAENSLKYFGNHCNVMAEIILSRYDLFISQKMITHLTTNLNSNEIEELYGLRVRSRMREMFNLISFDHKAKDKRI